ncbi:globin [Georgenia sp. AZ-5]|uniref:globin n=1 Tax=Georgenia sp. AZ-5 TaxID=3367526 RepID=UPI003754266F
MTTDPSDAGALFDALGGHETFRRLVHRFYEGVRTDEVLSPMYPHDDWAGAEERLRLFLEQYWGGPTTYSNTRGHPMLRRRHMPFAVTPEAREHWLMHMRTALDELELAPDLEHLLWDYLVRAASAMVNTPDATRTPLI